MQVTSIPQRRVTGHNQICRSRDLKQPKMCIFSVRHRTSRLVSSRHPVVKRHDFPNVIRIFSESFPEDKQSAEIFLDTPVFILQLILLFYTGKRDMIPDWDHLWKYLQVLKILINLPTGGTSKIYKLVN